MIIVLVIYMEIKQQDNVNLVPPDVSDAIQTTLTIALNVTQL